MKQNTKFTALFALVATLICALIAGVTLLAMPKNSAMTASAETEEITSDFATAWSNAVKSSDAETAVEFKLGDNWVADDKYSFGSGDGFNDGGLYLDWGQNIILDLNGYTIDRGYTEENNASTGSVITIYGGTLTLKDSRAKIENGQYIPSENGKITGGKAENGGGVKVEYNGSFIMESGSISGNSASYGGGVYVASEGYYDSATNVINNGIICNNTAQYNGGGIYFVGHDGALTINNGNIYGNKAESGAGIYVMSGSESKNSCFIMNGGTIGGDTGGQANIATESGGGIYMAADRCTFELLGNPVIKGNSAKNFKNLTLNGNKINITGALTDGAEIWVYNDAGTVITDGYTRSENMEKPAKFFKTDNYKLVDLNDSNEAYISDIDVTLLPKLKTETTDGGEVKQIEGYDPDSMTVTGLPAGATISDDGTINIPDNATAGDYTVTVKPKDDGYWDDGTKELMFTLTVSGGVSGDNGNTGDSGNTGGDNTGGDNTGNNPGGDEGGNTGNTDGGDNSADIGGGNTGNLPEGGKANNSVWPWIVIAVVALAVGGAVTAICILVSRRKNKK